jgi:pilus assembly protein Flp/PilA
MISIFRRLRHDQKGATAVEYGLIAALIVIAMITALGAFANESITMWTNVGNKVAAATP